MSPPGDSSEGIISVVQRKLKWGDNRDKIPTALVPLAPEKLVVEKNMDVLVGVFHIMWDDMPRRRTYQLRLQDLVSGSGEYFGSSLKCGPSEVDFSRSLD